MMYMLIPAPICKCGHTRGHHMFRGFFGQCAKGASAVLVDGYPIRIVERKCDCDKYKKAM